MNNDTTAVVADGKPQELVDLDGVLKRIDIIVNKLQGMASIPDYSFLSHTVGELIYIRSDIKYTWWRSVLDELPNVGEPKFVQFEMGHDKRMLELSVKVVGEIPKGKKKKWYKF